MRPTFLNGLAVGAGIASAVLLIGFVTLETPTTILRGGYSESIPAFHHLTNGGQFTCGTARCGSPGELGIQFWVGVHARLAGSLQTGAPIEIWVGNAGGMGAACGLSNPPPPCAHVTGPDYLYQTPAEVTQIDFGQLVFGFDGGRDVLPSGSWTILLINWSDSPISLTVDNSVTTTPTW